MEGRGGQVKLLAYVRGGTGFCWPISEGGLDFCWPPETYETYKPPAHRP